MFFRINHVEDHVENQMSGLDPNDLRSVHGKKLFENSHYLVQTHARLIYSCGHFTDVQCRNILKLSDKGHG